MEQTVTERAFSQEQQASQLPPSHKGPIDKGGTHLRQEPFHTRGPQRWTSRDRNDRPVGRFHGADTREDKGHAPVCRDNIRGKCARGLSCRFQHSDFVDHDGARFCRNDQSNLGPMADPRNSQLFSKTNGGDSSTMSIGGCRSRSPCRRFQSGRCYRGSACLYLHPEFTKYTENNIENSSSRSFFREHRSRSPCRNFQRGRCYRGSTCPYVHPDFPESDRPMHDWNAEQHHRVGAASKNPGFHEGNVNNIVMTSEVHDAANKENNSRITFSRESRNRSPCHNFLNGRCHLGTSCRRWHPVNAYKHHGFGDKPPMISSQKHDEAHQLINLRTESFSAVPRSISSCQYLLRGSCYQGAPSENVHQVNAYDRTRYDLGTRHHQGVAETSKDYRYDRGNVGVVYSHVPSYQDTRAGCEFILNGGSVNTHDKAWSSRNELAFERENADGALSWSSDRKRSRPASFFGAEQLQPEVCLRYTKGRCDLGGNCRYLHSFHEFASSVPERCQMPRPEGAADLSGQPIQYAETMVAQGHDTSVDNSFGKKPTGQPVEDVMRLNIVNQNGEELATDGRSCHNTAEGGENINLWSPPFKRQRTQSSSSVRPEDVHCSTRRGDYPQDNYHRGRYHLESRNQYPERHSYRCNGQKIHLNKEQHPKLAATSVNPLPHGVSGSNVMTPDAHAVQHDQSVSSSPCSETAISNENGAESLQCNQVDVLVTECITGENSEGATARDQMSVESDPKNCFKEHDMSLVNAAMDVLEKDETCGVNIDLCHEVNKKTKETNHIVQIFSRKKKSKSRRGRDSKSVIENVADTSLQSLPIDSSVGTASLDCKGVGPVLGLSGDTITSLSPVASSFEEHDISPASTSMVVSEKDKTAGVKVDLSHEVIEKSETNHVVKLSRKKKRKLRNMVESSSAATEDSILLDKTDDSALRASQSPIAGTLSSRRKLLVLDVNGLLADIVAGFPDRCKPFIMLAGKGVFKRPFCDEFLQFCFEKFDVGIWSSRTKKNVTRVVDCLMKETKDKLLFCWDQSQCTKTGFQTLENKEKPLVLKELNKLWENKEKNLPWKKGFYNETNTVLLDDSPYKALCNPPYTAVFPFPYSYRHQHRDKSLGPEGDLCIYLTRLAEAENVQKFIQENPFGQRAITKANPSWGFYSKVVGRYTSQPEAAIASSKAGFSKNHQVGKLSDTKLTVAGCSAQPSTSQPEAAIAISDPGSSKNNHVGKLSDSKLTAAECSTQPSPIQPEATIASSDPDSSKDHQVGKLSDTKLTVAECSAQPSS